MPSVDKDLANMLLAIDGVEEDRLALVEGVAEIKAICDSRPPLPDGEDDYLQMRKALDLPLPAVGDGVEARCELFREEVALIILYRDTARGLL